MAELLSTLRPKQPMLASVEEAAEALARLQLQQDGGEGRGKPEAEAEVDAEPGTAGSTAPGPPPLCALAGCASLAWLLGVPSGRALVLGWG